MLQRREQLMRLSLIFLCFIQYGLGLDNGLALTPPMGWLAWERFRCNVDCKNDPQNCISESLFMEMAERMATQGYKEAGYEYVILDDCWMNKSRDEKGKLTADPERFPSGIKFLAKYVHSLGLKLGIYEDIGTLTCGGYPGIEGHEEEDMKTFAEWDIDYVKLDGCYMDAAEFGTAYPRVGQFMNKTGRSMVYSCSWPAYLIDSNETLPWKDLIQYCNLWRNYDDIQDSYDSFTNIAAWFAKKQDELIPVAGPGHWNDPDMLLVGNFGLSFEQQKAQMAIWAILAAPLIMSNDLRDIGHPYRRILLNREVIAINQDVLGIQGRQTASSRAKGIEIWTRPVTPTTTANGATVYSYAVVIWNKRDDGTPYPYAQPISSYGLTEKKGYFIRNLYTGQDYGLLQPNDVLPLKVVPSGVVMFKATPVVAIKTRSVQEDAQW
ncbi:hypothetical protein RvY_10229 [Ramazzottius varieornatus]|uniref:Alpha-galactosidase n=1 Tax=Ramazzottius varieornatus TaxID=947166 RepID=A0A1D1VJV5_RAMVA|nr:hypothetical protein RvY_10229 [Ramazzottius varieornatus]